MASELLACDGITLLNQWWPKQSIALQDPEGWRNIMVAVGAHLPNIRITRESKAFEVGAVIAYETEGMIATSDCVQR
jgi:hypothetical protein